MTDPTRPEQTDVVGPPRLFAGKYRLGKLIGQGGMGSVYLAEHTGLGSNVAIKLLHETCVADPTSMARFRREAKAMAAVRHDNVVTVFDTGTDEDGVPFIVMEYLEGESLSSVLRRNKAMSPARAYRIATQVLAGLGAAHAAGVVHRDLKPANIFMARQADSSIRAKILDFGISRLSDAAQLSVTAEGVAIGTPTFMAPEQVLGESSFDHRVDIYAVGVMLYRMLSGRLPFAGSTSDELSQKIVSGRTLRLSAIKPEISEELERVVEKAMNTDPAERYADVDTFRSDLARVAGASLGHADMAPDALVALGGRPADAPTVVASPHAKRETMAQVEQQSRRKWIAVAAAAVGLAVGGGVAYKILAADGPSGPPVRFGITKFLPPAELEPRFAPLVEYLSRKTDRPVQLRIAADADELRGWLAGGEVELAALSPFPYVTAAAAIPELRLIATTLTRGGRSGYYGSILVRTESGIATVADLRGRPFCFVRQGSTSGWLLPRRELRRAGLDPDADFKGIHYGHNHLGTLKLLAKKVCDGAAVYTKLWHDADDHGLDPASFKSVVDFLMPHDAYVVAPHVDSALADELKAALLSLAENTELATDVLRELDQGGFVEADPSAYDSIREAVRAEQSAR